MNPRIHPTAIVESEQIGEGTRIWAFVHVLPGAAIGRDCNLCDHTYVENDVRVGNNVTIKCGVQLWDGVTIEDDVFIGPNVTFTNDPFPRSGRHPPQYARTVVKRGASIGANATMLPGITVGPNAMVGAGSVVTKDVPPNAIVKGNPARIDGYVTSTRQSEATAVMESVPAARHSQVSFSVSRVRLVPIPVFRDMRGSLMYAQHSDHLPFVPRRVFVIYDVPSWKVHGEHAHRSLEQILICLQGSVHINVDDGCHSDSVLLEDPSLGLYVPPMVWATQYRYTPDGMLLVLASDVYDESEYIRSYDEYLRLRDLSVQPTEKSGEGGHGAAS